MVNALCDTHLFIYFVLFIFLYMSSKRIIYTNLFSLFMNFLIQNLENKTNKRQLNGILQKKNIKSTNKVQKLNK